VICDKGIASGLKEDRMGLIELARRNQIDAIVFAYKDRLTIFIYLEELFKALTLDLQWGIKGLYAKARFDRDCNKLLKIFSVKRVSNIKSVKSVENAIKDN